MPRITRQAPKGAQLSRRMQLKRSSCLNTEGGARAHGTLETLADQAQPARGGDAWGRAPKPVGWPSTGGFPPPGGGQLRGTGQEDLAKRLATHQHHRSASGLRNPRFREERNQDSRRYRHRRGGLLLARCPHQDEDTGAGSDRAEEVEGSEEPPGGSLRAGHPLRTQGGCQAHCS